MERIAGCKHGTRNARASYIGNTPLLQAARSAIRALLNLICGPQPLAAGHEPISGTLIDWP